MQVSGLCLEWRKQNVFKTNFCRMLQFMVSKKKLQPPRKYYVIHFQIWIYKTDKKSKKKTLIQTGQTHPQTMAITLKKHPLTIQCPVADVWLYCCGTWLALCSPVSSEETDWLGPSPNCLLLDTRPIAWVSHCAAYSPS